MEINLRYLIPNGERNVSFARLASLEGLILILGSGRMIDPATKPNPRF